MVPTRNEPTRAKVSFLYDRPVAQRKSSLDRPIMVLHDFDSVACSSDRCSGGPFHKVR